MSPTPDPRDAATPTARAPYFRGALSLVLARVIPIVLVDGLCMQQGLISVVALVIALGQLLLTLAATRRREHEARSRVVRWTSIAAGALVSLAVIVGNNRLAERRARLIVAAVERYDADHHALPGSLEELVPTYLPNVPRAKLSFVAATFDYWRHADESSATLMWVVMPPFGRRTYNFTEHRWGAVD